MLGDLREKMLTYWGQKQAQLPDLSTIGCAVGASVTIDAWSSGPGRLRALIRSRS
jgi:hypothetical protein